MTPDELEVAPGFKHEALQGSVFEAANPEELREALEKAFDYRGDVTITCKDGSTVEGYVFDRHNGSNLADSYVRLFPKDEPAKWPSLTPISQGLRLRVAIRRPENRGPRG